VEQELLTLPEQFSSPLDSTPWQKEKVQKDKQRSTKHAHKTEDRVT
jgi:hypothetical protein